MFLESTAEKSVDLGLAQLIIILLLSVLGSMGGTPVPNSSVVMIYSIWTTIYPNVLIAASSSYLVASVAGFLVALSSCATSLDPGRRSYPRGADWALGRKRL